MKNSIHKKSFKLIILVSGRGSNMSSIIKNSMLLNWPIEILAVIADRDCNAINLAKKLSVPTVILDYKRFRNSKRFNIELFSVVASFNPDLVALAGFMRILNQEQLSCSKHIFLNIHPSILPKYKGLNTHKRVLTGNETFHGATVHSVTGDLDDGPIICQGVVPVLPEDNEALLAARVLDMELKIYPSAIAAILSKKIVFKSGVWVKSEKAIDLPAFYFSKIVFHPYFSKHEKEKIVEKLVF